MADLRDSGAVEEDSDAVCLLFRPSAYLPEEEKPKPWEIQDIEVIIDKCREGIPGIATLNYCGANSRITDKAYGY
jgi:replicative DNA helicase